MLKLLLLLRGVTSLGRPHWNRGLYCIKMVSFHSAVLSLYSQCLLYHVEERVKSNV